jgi:peroxiredoxin Q/BCP
MSQDSTVPEVGQAAPDFSGLTQDGAAISLSDFKNKKLAIYFYPRDNTPGCTKQACNLRDHFETLSDVGISIIGVSDDSVKKHSGFAEKYGLPFPLIADTDRVMMTAYGTYGQKYMYGRMFMGTKRITFLINEDGMIEKIIKKPKTGDHTAEIISGFGLGE